MQKIYFLIMKLRILGTLSSYNVEISWHSKAEGRWLSRNVILPGSEGNRVYFGQFRILSKLRILACRVRLRKGRTLA